MTSVTRAVTTTCPDIAMDSQIQQFGESILFVQHGDFRLANHFNVKNVIISTDAAFKFGFKLIRCNTIHAQYIVVSAFQALQQHLNSSCCSFNDKTPFADTVDILSL
ncbi:MAG: hypothetical protein JWN30_1787 [Bacilli bacterium]|nr:hypothetical protein [Bacilli bacterium]